MRYKNVLSIVLTILFITPLVAGVASLVATAQGGMISVPDHVYPGSTLPVTVNVPIAAGVTITVSNAVTGQQYATQQFYAPMPGTYTVNVQIPKVLPNIGTADPPTLLVTATIPLVGSDSAIVTVYPLIEVNPTASTIVDGLGNSKKVTVTGYGFPEGASVTKVNFIGLSGQGTYSYAVSLSAGNNGVVGPITIDLLNDLTHGYGIPAGSYNVNFTSTATKMVNASVPVFTVIPQLVILDNYGNGRDVERIRVAGYGFPAYANITKIDLFNTNFTNVVYSFIDKITVNITIVNVTTTTADNVTNATVTVTITYPNGASTTKTITVTNVTDTIIPVKVPIDVTTKSNGIPTTVYATVNVPATNATGMKFTITVNVPFIVDANGYFAPLDLKQIFKTNMSAGLYVPIVYLGDNTSYTFRNTYHLVRPILCYVISGVVQCDIPAPIKLPGDVVTIVAYGYGPGSGWGYPVNTLYVSFDRTVRLTNVTLDKDGNATFKITIPNATYGSHYIWGVDIWGYEYSLAVVVGGKAYWIGLRGLDKSELNTTKVTAGYPGMTESLIACPCADNITGYGYCAECVVYGGGCDYLGDYIRVVVTGLNPGESFTVYFGNLLVGNGTADSNGYGKVEFLVPTLPEGNYNITVVGEQSGSINVAWQKNATIYSATIVPKILALSLSGDYLPVIVGSGIVRILGTGFTPGVTFAGLLVNNTDAILAVTTNVFRWSADSNGVLTGYADTIPAVWIPMMHPGKYELTLAYIKGTQTYKSMPTYVYVVNNISRLVTVDNLNAAVNTLTQMLNSISAQINGVSSAIATLDGKVTSVSSKVDNALNSINTVSSKVDTVSSKVDSVASSVNTVSSKVDSALSKLDSIASAINSINLNAVTSQLNTINSKIDNLATAVSNVGSKVDSVASSVNTVSSKIDTSTSTLSSKIDSVASSVNTVSSKVDGVSSKVDTVSGKVDTAISTANNAFYVGLVAVIFALLATVFALLAYLTVRRSIVSK